MLNAVLTLALTLSALGLLLYLLMLLLRAACLPIDGFWERWQFARCVLRSQRGDTLRERGDLNGALREYQSAFFLSPIRNRALATRTANHHVGLLSRLIAITEDLQGDTVRLFSVAKVDRLLDERGELNRCYFDARGRADWRRRGELSRQLAENRRELYAALHQLIVEIQGSRQPERVH